MKCLSLCLASLLLVRASPTSIRPLVLWHGLGDSHSSPGMLDFAAQIKAIHPGIFVHSVYIEHDLDADRRAGFYGNVDEHVELAAAQIAAIPALQAGFDAIGFSQGGQFLRAYAERHNHARPPVRNLITFGAQHMGVSDIPTCAPADLLCLLARRAARRAVYSPWVQAHLVQAQYFRDPAQLPAYLAASRFLAAVNNERPAERNATYARNLAGLDTLVLVMFERDTTVVPKESAWFGSEEAPPDGARAALQAPFTAESPIVPMRLQPLYTEDWIGLRTLDERGAVIFETCEGAHMHIGDCWERLVRKFVGGPA